MKKIIVTSAEPPLKEGLAVLTGIVPLVFSRNGDGCRVSFEKGGEGLSVKVSGSAIVVRYAQLNQAFRALGAILGSMRSGVPLKSFDERQYFSLINVMLDVSRNAAMTSATLKDLLGRFALMGINSVMLYTETNYEVPGEPFWGYNTGKYSIPELTGLDRHAAKLGIEMFPCIQTLAHLRRALQWPAYRGVKDTETVLMVGAEKTYELIDRIIAAAMLPYRSRRVHVGMDEAWDLGQGNYLRKHGYKTRFELMRTHLSRVAEILRKRGAKPMMWSDMFFSAGSRTGSCYDLDVVIPDEIKAALPAEMGLVYWDYYHDNATFYGKFIDRHIEFSNRMPVVATGAQTWNRFWTHHDYAVSTIAPCMMACKEKGVQEVIMTVWGDDGNECDGYSILPVMQYYAEHAFNATVDEAQWRANLRGSSDIVLAEWQPAGDIDRPPVIENVTSSTNVSKFLLWEDPFYGLAQWSFDSSSLKTHFEAIADALKKSAGKKRAYNKRLALPAQLARVLTVKCDFPKRLYSAYQRKNKRALRKMLKNDIPFMIAEITKLWKMHRAMWLATYKPQGWETLEARYGGVLLRLKTLNESLTRYLGGKLKSIDELETPRLQVFEVAPGTLPHMSYADCYTATFSAVN